MQNLASIIIPIYGNFDKKRLDIVKESILQQKGLDVEIILPDEKQIKPPINCSKLINQGYSISKGNFVYISDADVVLASNTFLGDAAEYSQKNGNLILTRPKMRRLLLEDWEWFQELFKSDGIASLQKLDFSQEHLVTPFNKPRQIKVFKKFENGRLKTFIASQKDFEEYISDDNHQGEEPKYWNQERHCGGTFLTRNQFKRVGGYCEQFIGWVCWDADFQWKLKSLFEADYFPEECSFEVIHLDHSKEYFDKQKWEHDKKLQELRRNLGAMKCSEYDKVGDY